MYHNIPLIHVPRTVGGASNTGDQCLEDMRQTAFSVSVSRIINLLADPDACPCVFHSAAADVVTTIGDR